MQLIKLELLRNIRKKYFFIIFFAGVVFLAIYHLFAASVGIVNYLDHFQMVQKDSVIAFVLLLLLSYELFADVQSKSWMELVVTNKNGLGKIWGMKCILIEMMMIILFGIVLIIEVCSLKITNQMLPVSHVFRVTFLNYFLLPLLGTFGGMALAFLHKKRWPGYLSIIIIIICTCGVLQKISWALYVTTGINLDRLMMLVNFTQPNTTWVPDYVYLVPVENYRFFALLTWIFVCGIFVALKIVKNKKVFPVTLCAAAAVICFSQVVTAKNFVNYEMNYASPTNKASEFESAALPDEKKADFAIVDCRMRLRFDEELHADVTIKLDKTELEQYDFTLYRGYSLTELTDQAGQALEYEREYDYITVHAKNTLSEIHMKYHGYNQSLYSNSFGIMLPGYFAYYPQAGWRQVFWFETVESYQNMGFNIHDDTLQKTDFHIEIEDYDKPVYSNLPGIDQSFEGVSTAPTLIAGAVGEQEIEDGRIIYPLSCEKDAKVSIRDLKRELVLTCEYFDLDDSKYTDIQTIIYVPSGLYFDNLWGRYAVLDHYLLLGTDMLSISEREIASDMVKETVNMGGTKSNLLAIMFAVYDHAAYVEDLQPLTEDQIQNLTFDPEKEDDFMIFFDGTFDNLYFTLVSEYGEKEMAQRSMEYLLDENREENVVEFLQHLYFGGRKNETGAS